MLKQDKAVTSIDEFISSFDGYPTLFSHFVEADGKNRDKIKEEGHFIAHCPRSNRFLGCDRLKIEELIKLDIPFNVATDGLSSNYSLNIFDELRSALMLHHLGDINLLAKKLIDSVTLKAGQALKLDCGEIKKGYFADFTITKLPQSPSDTKDIPLWTILHTKEANGVYIGGKKYV
jgi:cytosine/adenosine deaminase-related metal-dependent hydrolase